ncbi:hypothetical protein Lfu02_57280 [Longispora fulva]|uniref:Uncharacterized protein n=1 Tax=Longispora fulva TaxID=619741 RepID=A0A8J7GGT4_9ACTN|nr:hypothetical protein [Longispora fulva]MBG6137290.1 hypothetical protein [Longispora fulva]GIG61356.1 hypothetical protein Lfu02_57280 [Longispora fulva]
MNNDKVAGRGWLTRGVLMGAVAVALAGGVAVTAHAMDIVPTSAKVPVPTALPSTPDLPLPTALPTALPTVLPTAVPTGVPPLPTGLPKTWNCGAAAEKATAALKDRFPGAQVTAACDADKLTVTGVLAKAGSAEATVTVVASPGAPDVNTVPTEAGGVVRLVRADGVAFSASAKLRGVPVVEGLPNTVPNGLPLPGADQLTPLLTALAAGL